MFCSICEVGGRDSPTHTLTYTHSHQCTHTYLHTPTYTHTYTSHQCTHTHAYTQNTPISHSKLVDVLAPVMDLFEDVKRKCMMRLEYENQMKCEAITSPTSKFYQKPFDYAMWKYAYYVCHKCKKVGSPALLWELLGLHHH